MGSVSVLPSLPAGSPGLVERRRLRYQPKPLAQAGMISAPMSRAKPAFYSRSEGRAELLFSQIPLSEFLRARRDRALPPQPRAAAHEFPPDPSAKHHTSGRSGLCLSYLLSLFYLLLSVSAVSIPLMVPPRYPLGGKMHFVHGKDVGNPRETGLGFPRRRSQPPPSMLFFIRYFGVFRCCAWSIFPSEMCKCCCSYLRVGQSRLATDSAIVSQSLNRIRC